MRPSDAGAALHAIGQTFPQMPPAVIESWLLPLYGRIPWPPDSSPAWKDVLRERTVKFWGDVRWCRRFIHWNQPALHTLDADHLDLLKSVYPTHRRDRGGYEPELKAFDAAVHTLRKTGRLAPPPILFRSNADYFEIFEGAPRLAALEWFYAGGAPDGEPQIEGWVGHHVPGSAARLARAGVIGEEAGASERLAVADRRMRTRAPDRLERRKSQAR